jgi:RNA polymerase sigma-70 factor (ECF subfamily)
VWKLVKSRNGRPPEGTSCTLSFENLCCLADEELFSHLEHQHADAVAVLYQRYRRLIFGVAFRILRDRGEAEDIVQNVFVDLYKTSLRFDPSRGTAKIWILQFAYSRSFRRRRQLASRRFYSTIEISEVEDLLTTAASAGQEVENSLAISSAVDSLGEEQKRVISLASEGHSLRDIAEATGEKLANVRHHYYRGLAKLRTQLGIVEQGSSRQRKEATDVTT